MKVSIREFHQVKGQRKNTKVTATRPNWAFKPDHQRAFTVRIIDSQYVVDKNNTPHLCEIHVKKDQFGYYYNIAYVLNKRFDDVQGVPVIEKTGDKYRVIAHEEMPDFWVLDPAHNKPKRKYKFKDKSESSKTKQLKELEW